MAGKKKDSFNYDMDGIIGILLLFLGFIIVGVYGRFFVKMANKTILFIGLSFFSTFIIVLIRRHRQRYPDLPDIYVFVCMIVRILNYMIVSIAGYSISHRIARLIFSDLVAEFDSLEGLNIGILAVNMVVPYLVQRIFAKRLFNTNI